MSGERLNPPQTFRSEVVVVNNPQFDDPVAQDVLNRARKEGFNGVKGVVVGKKFNILHDADTLPNAVINVVGMTTGLLANPTSEVVKKMGTEVVESLVSKTQK